MSLHPPHITMDRQLAADPQPATGESAGSRVRWLGLGARADWWRRAISLLGSAVVAVAVTAVLLGGLPWVSSVHAVTVLSGSMGEAMPAGSVALTRTVPAEDVRVGDVIAVSGAGDLPVLHRVVSIEEHEGQQLVALRGDANKGADPEPVLLEGEGDRVLFSVPYVGYLFAYLRTTWALMGTLLTVGIAFVLRTLRRTPRPPLERTRAAGGA